MNGAALQIDKQTFLKTLNIIQTELWELGIYQWRVRHYLSSYWQSLPDGEYTLCVSQGGVRNKEIPRHEKDGLKHIFESAFGKSFCGTVKLTTVSGEVVEIQGYTKR